MRTVRGECLDRLLIRNRGHLQHVLTAYLAHYNAARPHRGINLEVPVPSPIDRRVEAGGSIERVDILGGLIHQYRRAA